MASACQLLYVFINAGALNSSKKKMSVFREPTQMDCSDIQHHCHMTKVQFMEVVKQNENVYDPKHELNIRAQCLLFLMKLAKNHSFEQLSSLFTLGSHVTAKRTFNRILLNHFKHNINIRTLVDSDGISNDSEIDAMLDEAYNNMPVKFKELLRHFWDPAGLYRLGVLLNFDATYIGLKMLMDIMKQKSMWYGPRATHIAKVLNFTDAIGKVVGLIPLSDSSTPSNGDKYLVQTFIRLMDDQDASNYFRRIIRGNHRYFVILVTDAGLVVNARNRPNEVANLPTLTNVSLSENCLFLHTSPKHEAYFFVKRADGFIEKVLGENPLLPTMKENVVKFTRLLRKVQEMIHGVLKSNFQITNERKLPTSYLDPIEVSVLRKHGLEEFQDVPLLSFIITCCFSLQNQVHPGFQPALSDQHQFELAECLMKRLFVENPLLHPIWNVDFDRPRSRCRGNWATTTLAELSRSDFLNFPKLTDIDQLFTAQLLTSGKHALQKADQLITYMIQLRLAGQNLTRSQTIAALDIIPEEDFEVEYLKVSRPDDIFDPDWAPEGWDASVLGQWRDLTFVRMFIPSSYRSMSSQSNGHYCVFAFGEESSDRLGLPYPYNRIYFYYCYNCPALNGSMSCDRHLAALLKLLSFKQWYQSTERTINTLNVLAEDNRYVVFY